MWAETRSVLLSPAQASFTVSDAHCDHKQTEMVKKWKKCERADCASLTAAQQVWHGMVPLDWSLQTAHIKQPFTMGLEAKHFMSGHEMSYIL